MESIPIWKLCNFLTAQKFPHAPPLAGALEYRIGKDEPNTVAILTSFVPKAKDAWEYTLDSLGKFYERIQTLAAGKTATANARCQRHETRGGRIVRTGARID